MMPESPGRERFRLGKPASKRHTHRVERASLVNFSVTPVIPLRAARTAKEATARFALNRFNSADVSSADHTHAFGGIVDVLVGRRALRIVCWHRRPLSNLKTIMRETGRRCSTANSFLLRSFAACTDDSSSSQDLNRAHRGNYL
jgi:hypothetical protein